MRSEKCYAVRNVRMTFGKLLIWSFIICHLSFGVSACSSISCPVQNTVSVQYAVRDAEGEAMMNDTLWVFTQRNDGSDTLLLNRGVGIKSFSLPVSYSHPEDVLLFFIADKAGVYTLDTLWLKKEDIPHFESVDCSAHFFHRLTDVRCTHEGIDSVTIVNTLVDYDTSKTHLHIYFKDRQ